VTLGLVTSHHVRTILAALAMLWLAATPARAQAPKPADFELRPSASLQGRVDALAGKLRTSGVDSVLGEANRTATANGACRAQAFPGIPAGSRWFCFDAQDTGNVDRPDAVEWIPQGTSSSADAGGGRDALLVSWYDARTEPTKGVRVSFLDTATGKYRHVLLVYPYSDAGGKPNYEIVGRPQGGIHAGGIAWYGNRLYVADTTRGVRVFDLRFVFDLAASPNGDTSQPAQIGRHGSRYMGFGYRYVLPQVGAWVNAAGPDNDGDFTCAADGAPKFSFAAVDRSAGPHRLVTGEYCDSGALGRVARWPIAASGDLQPGADGNVHATEALRLPQQNIQGAVSIGDAWYLSRSRGSATAGQLLLATAAGGSLNVTATRTAGIGPEDLSYVPDRVWTVTEHAGRRMLYGVPR
jgi:hypothetical protein